MLVCDLKYTIDGIKQYKTDTMLDVVGSISSYKNKCASARSEKNVEHVFQEKL